jgi:hypothetical protein
MIEIGGEIEVVRTIKEIEGLKLKEEEGKDHIQDLQEVHLQVEIPPQVHPSRQDEPIQIEKKAIILGVLIYIYF